MQIPRRLIERLQSMLKHPALSRLERRLSQSCIAAAVTEERLKFLILQLVLFLFAFNLFVFRIAGPPYGYFDEGFYVSAGRQLVDHGINENWSHPPLGKFLIGVGIKVFGDTPAGWRLPGVFFGSLVIVAVFIWGLCLFGNARDAIKVALLTLFNQLLFVQSRVATVDIFMIGFLTIALAFVIPICLNWEESRKNHLLFFSAAGFFLALAAASKWAAFIPVGAILLWTSVASFRSGKGQRWRTFLRSTVPFSAGVLFPYFLVVGFLLWGVQHPFYAPRISEGVLAGYGLLEIFKLQPKMLFAQMNFSNLVHGYRSEWFSWPFMLRPAWLESKTWETEGVLWHQLVVLIGNPLVIWGGGFAIFICFVHGVRSLMSRLRDPSPLTHDQRVALIVVAWYLVFWASWGLIPRKTTFFYYYIPAALWLGPALIVVARILKVPKWAERGFYVLVVVLFVFYYPVVSFWEIPKTDVSIRLFLRNWWPN